MYVCMHVVCNNVCIHACMYVCMYVCMYACSMYVCMYVYMYVCMHVCVCMYVVYVCMYVCMHVCVCMYVCICMYWSVVCNRGVSVSSLNLFTVSRMPSDKQKRFRKRVSDENGASEDEDERRYVYRFLFSNFRLILC